MSENTNLSLNKSGRFPPQSQDANLLSNTGSGFPSQKKKELTTVSKHPIFDLINLTNPSKINPTSAAGFIVVQSNHQSCIYCSLKDFEEFCCYFG